MPDTEERAKTAESEILSNLPSYLPSGWVNEKDGIYIDPVLESDIRWYPRSYKRRIKVTRALTPRSVRIIIYGPDRR